MRVPGSVAGRSTTLKAMFSMAPPHLRKVALAALVVAVGLALRVFLLRSGFGDLNQHGPDAIRFYTKTKTVTSRWPSGVKDGASFVIPTMN